VVPALMVCPIDGGAGGELPGHRDRSRPRDRSAGQRPPHRAGAKAADLERVKQKSAAAQPSASTGD